MFSACFNNYIPSNAASEKFLPFARVRSQLRMPLGKYTQVRNCIREFQFQKSFIFHEKKMYIEFQHHFRYHAMSLKKNNKLGMILRVERVE